MVIVQIHAFVSSAHASAVPLSSAAKSEGEELLLHLPLFGHVSLGEEAVDSFISKDLVVKKVDSSIDSAFAANSLEE